MVYENFHNKIPMILDGGESQVGIESTVVRVHENKVEILRPGFITKEDIQDIVGKKIAVVYTSKGKQMSPGTRYQHYAPKAKVMLFKTIKDIQKCIQKNTTYGLIATDEFLAHHEKKLKDYGLTFYPR